MKKLFLTLFLVCLGFMLLTLTPQNYRLSNSLIIKRNQE